MIIKYFKSTEINRDKWDALISRSINGVVYAYSWYLDIMVDNWSALVAEDYKMVFPFAWRKKYGIKYIYQPIMVQQLGLFSENTISQDLLLTFFNAIPKEYKRITLQVNSFNCFELSNHRFVKRSNYELNLNNSFENIYKYFSENVKRNYKKSLKSNFLLQRTISPEELIMLFKQNIAPKIKGLKAVQYKRINQLMQFALQRGIGNIWGVYDENKQLCAAAFLLEINKRAIFLFSATNSKAKDKGAMFLLLVEFIKSKSGDDCVLDFEGSDIPGLARYYESFGAENKPYLLICKNTLPFPLNYIK